MFAETIASKKDWGVLILSHDGNSDLWPLFFHFLFKEWPDVPQPVYLITNFKSYEDERVCSLKIGRDFSWGECMQKSLDKFPHEIVFSLLDDFFLREQVDSQRVENSLRCWANAKGRYLETRRKGTVGPRLEGTPLRALTSAYAKAGINSAAYTKDFLRLIAQPGLNVWQANTRLADMNRSDEKGMYYFAEDQESLVDFEECVRGRFWKPHAVEFLTRSRVRADFRRRPCPIQSRTFLGRLIRSFRKYLMSRQTRKEYSKLSAGWSCKVFPLNKETLSLEPEIWSPPSSA
jgi:hypothetical protein